uniref:Alternative protein ZCCHC16 n=1 Tax=Homo sapiens TaxID=9606 RepID=L8EC62_HUMAN|nr:alternative protein ZCCHC16 [Homo sapiens]
MLSQQTEPPGYLQTRLNGHLNTAWNCWSLFLCRLAHQAGVCF